MTTHEVRCRVNVRPILHFVANLLINDCAIGDLQRPWRLVCMPHQITTPYVDNAPQHNRGVGRSATVGDLTAVQGTIASRIVSSVCTR
jgi:hypothetical protein